MKSPYLRDGLVLLSFFLLANLLPNDPIDPWKIFSLKKITTVILVLIFIQTLGSVAIQLFGTRLGAIFTGFLGGLVSSTATTAALARRSLEAKDSAPFTEKLTFLSANIAMLFEGLIILFMSTQQIHPRLLVIFGGPLLTTIIFIFIQSKKIQEQKINIGNTDIKIFPILKLTIFIFTALALSKLLQFYFGENGLLTLTFLVSLFEVHGSLIANIQLHDAGAIEVPLLGSLIAISIASSLISKLFLISTIGSQKLKLHALKYSLVSGFSLFVGWIFFISNP